MKAKADKPDGSSTGIEDGDINVTMRRHPSPFQRSSFAGSFICGLLLAMVFIGNGCTTRDAADDVWHEPSFRSYQAIFDLGRASVIFYSSEHRWPNSLGELQTLPANREMSAGAMERYNELSNAIPWPDLKDKVTLVKMPDGRLSISVPQFDPSQPTNAVTGFVLKPN